MSKLFDNLISHDTVPGISNGQHFFTNPGGNLPTLRPHVVGLQSPSLAAFRVFSFSHLPVSLSRGYFRSPRFLRQVLWIKLRQKFEEAPQISLYFCLFVQWGCVCPFPTFFVSVQCICSDFNPLALSFYRTRGDETLLGMFVLLRNKKSPLAHHDM